MKITLYDHPFSPAQPQVFEVESLGEWLLEHYGAALSVQVQIFVGEPCAENEISQDAEAILRCSVPEVVVLQSPGDPVTILVNIAISIVLGIVAQALAPSPQLPANVNRTQASPNNALGERSNQVRLLQRVEDIYGTVKSIPSLLMPTYNKYLNHQKFEYGYYCIGRGYHAIDEVRDGDTLIADIPGASASVYNPFTSPNSGNAPMLQIGNAIIDKVLTVRRAIEVDGITLKAQNQVGLPVSASYTFAQGGVVTQTAKQPNVNAVTVVGDSITVTMSPVTVDDPGDPNAEPPVPASSATYNYSGTYSVTAVNDGNVVLGGTSWVGQITTTCSVQIAGKTAYTAWITLPDVARTEVWCNTTAPNGMFRDSGGKSLTGVNYSIEIEKLSPALVPMGVVETINSALNGAVSDERAETIEHATAWTGPARVRMRRSSDYDYTFAGTIQDEIKWADLYSVSPVSKSEFGNKTTIHTITQATARATAVKSRQLNCLASRKLPIYNGSTFSGCV